MKTITCTTDIKPESKFDLDSVLFFDIETTGLSRTAACVYLVGCAYKENGNWMIRQFLAECEADEEALVKEFYAFAESFQTLFHFNGNGFDVPFMDTKAELYGVEFRLSGMENYDILLRTRAAKKLHGMQKMNQKSVETFLRIKRDDEMGGGELIPFFYDYAKTGDQEKEKFLLLHNFDDIQGMLKILPIVNYADVLDGCFQVEKMETGEQDVTIDLRLETPIPRAIEKDTCDYLICANDDFMQIVIRLRQDCLCHYLEDYQNYYYLPDEDRVIHKDLARFVEKGHKKKATKKNCYVKKESCFVPQIRPLKTPCFCDPSEPKKKYLELEVFEQMSACDLKEIVLDILNKA